MIRKQSLVLAALGGLVLAGCSSSPRLCDPCAGTSNRGFFSRLFNRNPRPEVPIVDVGPPAVTEGPILVPGAPCDGGTTNGIPTNGLPVGPMPRLVPTPQSQPIPANP